MAATTVRSVAIRPTPLPTPDLLQFLGDRLVDLADGPLHHLLQHPLHDLPQNNRLRTLGQECHVHTLVERRGQRLGRLLQDEVHKPLPTLLDRLPFVQEKPNHFHVNLGHELEQRRFELGVKTLHHLFDGARLASLPAKQNDV